MTKLFLYAFSLATMIAVAPAFAEETVAPTQPTKVYVHRSYEHQEVDKNDHRYQPNLGRAGEIAISDNDRIALGHYLNYSYKQTCAWEHDLRVKKCVAPHPDQKRNYIIGYALPSDAVSEDIPVKIISRLHPIPDGYKYLQVEHDVVLINASTREVIDSVTLTTAYAQ